MSLKILLVHHDLELARRTGDVTPYPPLGLACIAAVLKKNHFDVEMVDGVVERLTNEEIKERIEKSNADIVGITCWTPGLQGALDAARISKEILPDCLVVLGGPHLMLFPKETVSNPFVDVGVIGEGELTMLELAKKYQDQKAITDILGTVTKDRNQITVNERRPFIKRLNELPFPARELLPFHLYQMNGERWTSMITTRGCPFRCAFCNHGIWGRKVRFYSPEYVVAEMRQCIEKFGVKRIIVYDETFTINKKRVLKICELMLKERLNLRWGISSRVDTVDREMLTKLHQVGCEHISFGVESGTQEILDKMKKDITLNQAREAIKVCREVGISTNAYFMIGYPGENRSTIEKTIKFAKELDPEEVTFNIVTAYPGTELYQLALDEGYIKVKPETKIRGKFAKDRYDYFLGARYCTTSELTEEVLESYLAKAYRDFYSNPVHILRRVKRVKSFRQITAYVRNSILKRTH